MAISLNNHETRIKALENKSSTSSSWSVTKDVNGWMLENSTGIMIQWMKVSGSGTKRFVKAFNTKALAIFISPNWARVGGGGDNAGCGAEISSTSQFTIYIDGGAATTNYILAIGYLISDRILKYAYACKSLLFTPPRTIGGVK